MKITNSNDDNVQGMIDLMESSPNDFKHLQVFLNRERVTDIRPDNYFLMITPISFGKVEVLDLNVECDFIHIEILDCKTQQVGNVRIGIDDKHPKTLFIRWQDIRQMVLDENAVKISNDDLLNFDF